jgi:hypothetical protein
VKITSPIGDYDYRVERVALRGGQIEVDGRLGEWETTMVLERSDLLGMLRKVALALMLGFGLFAVTRRRRRV